MTEPRRRRLSPASLRRRLIAGQRQLPLVVLLLGLGLTAAVAEQTRRLGQQTHEQIERALLDDVADAIEVKLKEVIDTINGVVGLFNSTRPIGWDERSSASTTRHCAVRRGVSAASRASVSVVS